MTTTALAAQGPDPKKQHKPTTPHDRVGTDGQTNQLLPIPVAAKRLGISARTVWALIASDDLPCVRIGPRITRITAADLAQFIKLRRTNKGA